MYNFLNDIITTISSKFSKSIEYNLNYNHNSPVVNTNVSNDVFFDYQQIIRIRQFLSNPKNLEKVINFYKKNTNILDKFYDVFFNSTEDDSILNNYKSVTKEQFLDVYDFSLDYNIIDNIDSSNDKILIINLYKLYESRQFELGQNIFDIFDEKKYFPLKLGNLCYMTNYSKLNVIIWLIEIGFYDANINLEN